MRLLLDTTVLVDHLRGDRRATALLTEAARGEDEIWSVTVVRTEVLAGMRPREEAPTQNLLDQILWQDITIEIADHAGELARRYIRSHPGVDTVDYLVAAGATVLDARVCTTNVKHFPMFRGLRPVY